MRFLISYTILLTLITVICCSKKKEKKDVDKVIDKNIEIKIADTLVGKKSKCNDCNLIDSNNQKYGLWISEDGIYETYYKNNLKHGIYKAYYKNTGKIHGLGEFKFGKPAGIWYYFWDNGQINMIESEIVSNPDTICQNSDGTSFKPNFKSYLKIFELRTGQITGQGFVIYDDEIEIDFIKVGTWIYYNQKGIFLKTETY